jgi:cell division protein ZapA
MKQQEVTILGQSYILGCPDGGEALLSAAVASVDREMSAIRDAGKVKARERMAVLAALNLAYQLADRPQRSAAKTLPAEGDGARIDAQIDAQIDALIRRVDAALGEDGRLL